MPGQSSHRSSSRRFRRRSKSPHALPDGWSGGHGSDSGNLGHARGELDLSDDRVPFVRQPDPEAFVVFARKHAGSHVAWLELVQQVGPALIRNRPIGPRNDRRAWTVAVRPLVVEPRSVLQPPRKRLVPPVCVLPGIGPSDRCAAPRQQPCRNARRGRGQDEKLPVPHVNCRYRRIPGSSCRRFYHNRSRLRNSRQGRGRPSAGAGSRSISFCETSLNEACFARNATPRLTRMARFARFPVRCAPFGPAHPLMGPCAARGREAGLFEKETAFSGDRPCRSGRFGRARKAAPDSKVSLCWDSKRTRNRNRSPASAGTKGLDFNHSESLILAQNERWQRG